MMRCMSRRTLGSSEDVEMLRAALGVETLNNFLKFSDALTKPRVFLLKLPKLFRER